MDMNGNMLVAMTGAMMADAEKTAQSTEKTAREVTALRQELVKVKAELEHTRNDLACYKSEQKAQHDADAVKAVGDFKSTKRHNYCVTAFGCALTLLIEHFDEVCQFGCRLIVLIRSLFH